MSIIWIILLAVAVPACAIAFVHYLVIPMQKSTHRTLLLVLSIAVAVIFDLLLIMLAMIPSKADAFLTNGIARIEANINNISPGYVHQELDAGQIKTVLADTKQIESYLNTNAGARLAVRLIGVHAYVGYLESFTSNIDRNLSEMEAESIPLTLHNIFTRIQDKSHEPILHTTKVLEYLLLVALLLCIGFLAFSYFAAKKEWLSETSITLGDNI